MATLMELEKRVAAIEERNRRVETDKTWETSYTRRILLFLFMYLALGAYFQAIHITQPWLNAIGAAVGFMLSTLTLPYFKSMWLKHKGRQ